jgi:hypothetical protein
MAVALAVVAKPCAADVSSWLFVGGGASSLDQASEDATTQPLLQIETGMGSPPGGALIVGGLGRLQTHFGAGTDLGLALRVATHGFANGDWGGAVDLGGYQRWWGKGSTGGAGALVLGAPWGLTLNLGAHLGTDDARGFTAALGIDFARLTVYRRSGENWWKNTFPAYRPGER